MHHHGIKELNLIVIDNALEYSLRILHINRQLAIA